MATEKKYVRNPKQRGEFNVDQKIFPSQMFASAASLPHWMSAARRVGKGVDLSREGGVGGRELGRDMLEEEGRVGLRKRVGGREGRRLAAAGDAGGW